MKIPRDLAAKVLIKALKKYGYEIVRQSGSHITLTTSLNGVHHITIPNHNPLKIGTLSSILQNVAEHLNKSRQELMDECFKS
jgi:predicted RNA binding protein YcfA (HicA-like mRNA interferase family)